MGDHRKAVCNAVITVLQDFILQEDLLKYAKQAALKLMIGGIHGLAYGNSNNILLPYRVAKKKWSRIHA